MKILKCFALALILGMFTVPASASGADFHIGMMTSSTAQGEDDLLGAERVIEEYGDSSTGGMITHVTYPHSFMDAIENTISMLVELADDPKMKVIVVNQAVPGTALGFRRIREKRPDIILLAGETHEETGTITEAADLTVNSDHIARGYLIPLGAQMLGAKNFVHISFQRHMNYETVIRRYAIMEEACKDLGIDFISETAPDPLSDVQVLGAQQYIYEYMPGWLEKYGKDTAFFCTNDAHTEPLLMRIAELGGYFVEADLPSPLMGYPGALEIDLSDLHGDWPAILEKVEAAVIAAGGSGRMGTWAYSYGYAQSAALVEFGKRVVEGKAKLDSLEDLIDCYNKYTPGAKWNASYYTDAKTGEHNTKLVLVYQDTYVFGKGYLGLTNVKVPEKYFTIDK